VDNYLFVLLLGAATAAWTYPSIEENIRAHARWIVTAELARLHLGAIGSPRSVNHIREPVPFTHTVPLSRTPHLEIQ